MEFQLDTASVPEGTVLLFGIRYAGPDQEGISREPAEEAKVYTYAMIKAGGFWYVTGGGRTPQAAGWGAVQRWLSKDNRQVVYVKMATSFDQLWPRVDDLPEQSAEEELRACPVDFHGDPAGCSAKCFTDAGEPVPHRLAG